MRDDLRDHGRAGASEAFIEEFAEDAVAAILKAFDRDDDEDDAIEAGEDYDIGENKVLAILSHFGR